MKWAQPAVGSAPFDFGLPVVCHVRIMFYRPAETRGRRIGSRRGGSPRAARGGKRDGMKSRRECVYRRELDLETLV